MKLEVYESNPEREPVVRLRLDKTDFGAIELVSVDEYGFLVGNGVILTISQDGGIRRASGVDDSLGFPIDKYGKIIVS